MTTSEEMARALHLPPGLPGSGRLRYAAAMWFHARGGLGPRALEVFRVLAPRDGDDPAPLLAGEALPSPPDGSRAAALAAVVRELLEILRCTEGRGIAETRRALSGLTGAPAGDGRENAVVTEHLPAALKAVADGEPMLAAALADATPHLPWTTYRDYPEAAIGPAFGRAHAFCSILGETDACWYSARVDIGLFLMAPHLFYRDHAHSAPELYLPLTGRHSWRHRPGAPLIQRGAFEPVWTDPETPHATLAGPTPFLCLYAWLAHPQDPARVVPAGDWSRHER